MRSFLSITPDADTAIAIERWSSLCWPAVSRLVPLQNYHITLAFLGEVNAACLRSLQESLDEVAGLPFEMTLNEVGFWPDSRTLWLGSSQIPEDLLLLAACCKQKANRLGVKVENRRYHPHLTLARNSKTLPGPPLIDPDFPMFFDSFQLYQSVMSGAGVRYIELNSWSLDKKTA